MATWHQSRNSAGLAALHSPHATAWKVVSDQPHQFASAIMFRLKRDATKFARKTGGRIVAPTRIAARKGA